MDSRALRLLVTARDVGAASHLAVVARAALHRPGFAVTVAAEPPAADAFAAAGVRAEVLEAADADWPVTVMRLLEEVRPDAVLVGLSGLGRGIDEAILASATTPHTYAFQDYWGDINPGWGTHARTFFVLDNEAARLTRRRLDVRTIAAGNLRYAAPAASLDPLGLRAATRQSHGIAPDATVVGFYGQGHLDVPGYWRTVEAFAAAVASLPTNATVLFRPHPLEREKHRERTMAALTKCGRTLIVDHCGTVEESVAAADVVCTCYSSCGQVQNYLNCVAPRPLGVVVYMMFDSELVAWFRDYTHLESVPMIEYGLAPSSAEDLAAALRTAVAEEARQSHWALTRRVLKVGETPAQTVLDVIAADILAPAAGQSKAAR